MSSRAASASGPGVATRVVWPVAKLIAGAIALPVMVLLAAREGLRTRRRRRRGESPRLLWGPSPVISISYWSGAVRGLGYDSTTFAHRVPGIYAADAFDVHRDSFLKGIPRADVARDFFVFAWALSRADVFVTSFDGGYLRGTALRSLEAPLLRLAGKKLILFPFGGDIAVVGELGPAEEALLRDYPQLARTSARTRRRVVHLCRWADLVIRNYQFGFLPRADVVWPTQIALDADRWRGDGAASDADGRSGEVVVVHAPNHRHIKGTQHLIDAVGLLREEGLRVRLELLERRPNEEVRAAVHACDVVADQFIAGYALFAIEGMSAGKPVMSAMSWMPPEIRETPAMRECPIVDTHTGNLVENLRRLVEDPGLRGELGRAGREFVLRYHAYEPVARTWAALVEHVWRGTPLPPGLVPRAPGSAAQGSGTSPSSVNRATVRGS